MQACGEAPRLVSPSFVEVALEYGDMFQLSILNLLTHDKFINLENFLTTYMMEDKFSHQMVFFRILFHWPQIRQCAWSSSHQSSTPHPNDSWLLSESLQMFVSCHSRSRAGSAWPVGIEIDFSFCSCRSKLFSHSHHLFLALLCRIINYISKCNHRSTASFIHKVELTNQSYCVTR